MKVKQIVQRLLCFCIMIGLLLQTIPVPGVTLVANAAQTSTATEFLDGREVIRITNDSPKVNPYGIGNDGRLSLGLFMNILRNNPNAYIIMETNIVISNTTTSHTKIIPRNLPSQNKTIEMDTYNLYPEVDTFNGVLDGNGHTIENLQLSINNYGVRIPASKQIGMIHTLGQDGVIKNLVLENPAIEREVRMSDVVEAGGFLAYDNKGVIENCTLKNVDVNLCGDANGASSETYLTGGADSFGGFSGENNGTIRDCRVEGMSISVPDWDKKGTTTQPTGFGGIANTNSGAIENCILTGLCLNAKVACHEKGTNYTNFGGAVGVNTGTVSNVHVEYNLTSLGNRLVGDPGSLYYVENDPNNGMYKWFTDNYSPTAFGRVIGSNNGTYSGLTSILYDANHAAYTAPQSEPYRNRMIGSDNGSTTGNNDTTPYDISVTFSQADVSKNTDVYDAKFSVLSGEDATGYYKLSDTAVTAASTLESSGTSATLTANTSNTLTLSGLDAGKTYTCYVAAKKADSTWSDIKSFTIITPKKSPALTLVNPSESLDREYSGTGVNHTQELFSWQGDGKLTFSYYYYKGYSTGVVKTTTANSGSASDGAAPVNVVSDTNDTYYLKATLSSSGEYDGASILIPFRIIQADTEFKDGIQVYKNDTLQTAPYNFTYGDKLTVKVKPAIAGAPSDSTVKATGNMALYAGSTQLSDIVSTPDENGYYTLTYDTVTKKVLPGDLTLTVKYAGSNDMKPLNEDTNIKLNKRAVTFTANDPICNVEYTGGTTFTCDLYNKYHTVQPPCLLAADDKMLNINGTVTVPSPNAGNYSLGFTPENLKLVAGANGDASAFYYLDTDSVKNGYATVYKKSISTTGLNFNIDVMVGEGNFDEPKYAPINEKGTFSYTYNGTSITYQEIKDKLAVLTEGSTLSVNYVSILDNPASNYEGQYSGKINFRAVPIIFSGVNEALSVHPLTNLIYGFSWGELFAFDASKMSCTGASGKNVPGTYTVLADGVPFDPATYPKAYDNNNAVISHEYKVLFNSTDGTIKDWQINSIRFNVRPRFVEVECLNPVFIYKPGVMQNPELRIKNKAGNDNVTASMWSGGNSQPGEYEYRILLEGSDAKQYTDYRVINDRGEYVKISYKIIGLNFTGTLTPKAYLVTYGDTWNDILPFTQNTFSALSTDGKAVTGTYHLQVKGGGPDYADITGTDIPNPGSYSYQVIFSSDIFGDTKIASGYFGIQKREIRLEWGNCELTYTGGVQAPTATISNRVGNDDVGVTVWGYAEVGTHFALVSSTLLGADKDKYKVPDPLPTQRYSITQGQQNALTINPVTGQKYRNGSFALQTTGGSGNGDITYSVPENNGVLAISGNTATIIGAGKVTVTATKAADANYNAAAATLEITIDKADAPTLTFPTASGITYGQKLSASTLTGGSTEYGTFAWTDGNTVPTVKNNGYEVTFTPNAATLKNYKEIQPGTVAIAVSRTAPAVAVDAFKSSTGAVLTATVTGMDGCAVPTGTVKFVNSTGGGDVDIAGADSVAVTGGKAVFQWTGAADQIDTVKAVYSGDDNYSPTASTAASVKMDSTPPTGKITIGTSWWDKFLTGITFGFYHIDPNTVTIESTDSESGINTTQYFIAADGTTYTQEQLAAKADGWQDYNAVNKPALTEGQKSVVYAKITNNAGLVTYLSSDGVILDNTAPTNMTIGFKQNPFKTVAHFATFGLFFGDTVDVNFTADDSVSGIDHYEYQVIAEGGNFDANGTWQTGSLSITSDFKGTVYARAIDKTGNVSSYTAKSFIVDKTIPTIMANSGSSVLNTMDKNVSIPVKVKDNGAGIGTVTYQINGGAVKAVDLTADSYSDLTKEYSFSIGNLPDGAYNVTINATDNSGNAADSVTVHITKNVTQTGFSFASTSLSKTYGDAPFTAAVAGGQGDGTVTYTVTSGVDVLSVDSATGKVTIQKVGTAVITATKAASGGYLQATSQMTVNVLKAAPTIQTVPTASNITVIGKLSSSKLTDGKASVPGTFNWTNPDTIITKSGNYEATFTPIDTDHYSTVTCNVPVTVTPLLTDSSNTQLDLSGVTLLAGVTSVSLGSAVQGGGTSAYSVVETLIGQNKKLGDLSGLTVYDLKLLDQNGNPIEHFNGNIKVKLPIPTGMSGNLKVFWYNPADGTLTDMAATQKDGYLVFETNHFSYYTIAQFKSSGTSSNTTSGTSSSTASGSSSGTSSSATSGTTENPKTDSGSWLIIPLALFGGSAAAGTALIKRRKMYRIKKKF